MNMFCRHRYQPKGVLWGENLFGLGSYAVALYCARCGKRKLKKGYRTRTSAEAFITWWKEQYA